MLEIHSQFRYQDRAERVLATPRSALTNSIVEGSRMAQAELCAVSGCGKAAHCQSLCNGHYYRWKRYGDPLAGRTPDGEPLRFLRAAHLHKADDCIFWPYASGTDGYGQVRYEGRMWRPSRLICLWTHGDPPTTEAHAGHSCDNGHLGCINRRHIAWRSAQENANDRLAHGTVLARESAPSARLSEGDVAKIRALAGQVSQEDLARRFAVSQGHVSRIILNKAWVSG
jgi:hypothetical protein